MEQDKIEPDECNYEFQEDEEDATSLSELSSSYAFSAKEINPKKKIEFQRISESKLPCGIRGNAKFLSERSEGKRTKKTPLVQNKQKKWYKYETSEIVIQSTTLMKKTRYLGRSTKKSSSRKSREGNAFRNRMHENNKEARDEYWDKFPSKSSRKDPNYNSFQNLPDTFLAPRVSSKDQNTHGVRNMEYYECSNRLTRPRKMLCKKDLFKKKRSRKASVKTVKKYKGLQESEGSSGVQEKAGLGDKIAGRIFGTSLSKSAKKVRLKKERSDPVKINGHMFEYKKNIFDKTERVSKNNREEEKFFKKPASIIPYFKKMKKSKPYKFRGNARMSGVSSKMSRDSRLMRETSGNNPSQAPQNYTIIRKPKHKFDGSGQDLDDIDKFTFGKDSMVDEELQY